MNSEKDDAQSPNAIPHHANSESGSPAGSAPALKRSLAQRSLKWAIVSSLILAGIACLLRLTDDDTVAWMAIIPASLTFWIFLPLSFFYGICAIIGKLVALVRRRPSPPIWPAGVSLSMLLAFALAPYYGLAAFYLKTGIRIPMQTWHHLEMTNNHLDSIVDKLEARYRDAGAWYPWRPVSARKNQIPEFDKLTPEIANLPTFEFSDQQNAHSSDLNLHPAQYGDDFAHLLRGRGGVPFAYYATTIHDASTSATGYIVWSCGPDMKHDLTAANIETAYRPGGKIPSDYLVQRIYDPTNGAFSAGDIVRYKGGDSKSNIQ